MTKPSQKRALIKIYLVISEEINRSHNENIKKDPIVITILTDKSKINIDKILDYGELIELEKKNIFN